MRTCWVLPLALAVMVSVAAAADRSGDFDALCDQVETQPFVPSPSGPRRSTNPIIATIEATGDPHVIRRVLDPATVNRSLNERGTTPLAVAASSGNWPAVKVLLELGADINFPASGGAAPIEWALFGQHYGVACGLVKRGALIPKQRGREYLLAAASSTDVEKDFPAATATVAFLLDHGFEVDARFEGMGETALMAAAGLGNLQLIRELLARGADRNLRNGRGETAAMIAARAGKLEAERLLRGP